MYARSSKLRYVTLVAVVALLVTACSGDESGDDTTTTTVDATPATEAPEQTTTTQTPATTMGAPTEVDVTTYYGGDDTVPYDPQRVVVLDYAILDTLDALGLGDRVVGIPSGTTVPPYLSAYSDRENVGNLFEFDVEAINALEPDLIIVGGRSYDKEEEMEEIAPALNITYEWGSQTFIDSFVMNTTAIGQIFGIEDQVQAALSAIDAATKDVAAQAADDGTGLVILTSGGEVSAYGPSEQGRFDVVYNVLGVNPAADQIAIDTHGDAISFEFLADTNPDILIVLDRDAAIGREGPGAQEILDNDLVNGTSAVQNGNVVYVDTAKWYLAFGGLTAMQSVIDEVDSVVD